MPAEDYAPCPVTPVLQQGERTERLVIANRTDELRRMSQWLNGCAVAMSLPAKAVFNLDVCANEAVANICSYAHEDGAQHEITLELTGTDEGVRLVIRDDGKPFNPLEWPEPAAFQSIEEARIGGLGILLMRQLLSGCDYRRNGSFNELILEARRDPPRGNA